MKYAITLKVKCYPQGLNVDEDRKLAKQAFTDHIKFMNLVNRVRPDAEIIDKEYNIWEAKLKFPFEAENPEQALIKGAYQFIMQWKNTHGELVDLLVEDEEGQQWTLVEVPGGEYEFTEVSKVKEVKAKKVEPKEEFLSKGSLKIKKPRKLAAAY